MRRKTAICVALSGLVHLILVCTLLVPPVAEVAVVEQDQIEVDFRTVGMVTPLTPPLDATPQKVDRASRAARESTSSGKHSKGESQTTFRPHPNDGASATAIGSETKPGVLSPSPSADRLWSLRAAPGVEPTPFVNKLAAEDPSVLFRHAVPNVIRDPGKSVPSEVVVGHGDVKMHLDPDGRIAGFEDPKAKVGVAGGRFDLNDVLIRATGKQPYRYERHRLAEATRDDRICQHARPSRRLCGRTCLLQARGPFPPNSSQRLIMDEDHVARFRPTRAKITMQVPSDVRLAGNRLRRSLSVQPTARKL